MQGQIADAPRAIEQKVASVVHQFGFTAPPMPAPVRVNGDGQPRSRATALAMWPSAP